MKEAVPQSPKKRRFSDSGYRAVDIYTTFENEQSHHSTIVFTSEDHSPLGVSLVKTVSNEAKGCCMRFWKENWVFLILLGLLSACVVMFIDICYQKLFEVQILFSNLGGDNFFLCWLLWLLYSLFFASLSWACVVFISPHAAGSGIPEMRCILSGVEIRRYLSFRTLIAKVIGLIAAFVAGFSIGKEGPIIHISSIICRQMTRIPFFKHIHLNDATFLEVLSAACAGGVTLAFGSPIGGALFSIEATSSFYLTSNLWKGFFVSACGAVLLTAAGEIGNVAMFFPDKAHSFRYHILELFAFAILGLIGGILGAIFVQFVSLVFKLQTISAWFKTRRGRLFRVLMVGVVASASTFGFYRYAHVGTAETILDYLIYKDTDVAEWGFLSILLVVKVVVTVFSVAYTGLPAGVYGAGFLTGAIYGRLFGEIMKIIFPLASINPGSYAVIGAASMASSISHTVSTVVIVIELTKEINLLLPVLVAVLISVAVCRLLSDSVFDVIIKQRELPLMPTFDLYASYYQTAAELMKTNYEVLHFDDTFGRLAEALDKSRQTVFPLVDENHVFLGAVRRSNIERVLIQNSIIKSKSVIAQILHPEIVDEALSKDGKIANESDEEVVVGNSSDIELVEPGSARGILAALGDSFGPEKENSSSEDQHSAIEIDQHQKAEDRVSLSDPVPFVFLSRVTGSSSGNIIEVDSTVMQIDSNTSIFKTHFLFTMLGLGNLFVTSRGKLCGIITRTSLIRSISAMPQQGTPNIKRIQSKDSLTNINSDTIN